MRKFIFLVAIIAAFFFISCGNDTHTTKNDNEQTNDESVNDESTNDSDSANDETTNDETTDESTDEATDEFVDETTDELPDETTDEAADDDSDSSECTNLNVDYSNSGLDTVATNISLAVYSNGWGNLLDTLSMATEGNIKLEVNEENPYDGNTPSYFIYETATGFFTNTNYAVFNDTIAVDLDPIMPDYVNGVIFMVQNYFGPTDLSNTAIEVTDSSGKTVGCFNTDGNGRFVINIPDGNYTFNFTDMDGMDYNEGVTINSNYIELRISAEAQVDKPNIYIYPEETTELDVSLDFPHGGHVIKSIPEYGTGWHVTVEPDGTIDGMYGYLFYESQNPDLFQYKFGWTVKNSDLETFFRTNLASYGFEGREINDFIEWWIPRLDGGCYDIYPQTAEEINPVITLNISKQPDSLQRLFYAVRKTSTCSEHLAVPEIKSFNRTGFSLLEWGVILR